MRWMPLRQVFPVLANVAAEEPPADIPCHHYSEIARLLPALVRRTAQNVWYDTRDPAIAAADVFDEEDGTYSVFEVHSVEDLMAVATYLSRGGDKPFRRAVYFCVFPGEARGEMGIVVFPTTDSRCKPLNALHRHATVGSDQRERLFRIIQESGDFNYRVDRKAMQAMRQALLEDACLDYSDGPCARCSR